MQNLSPEALLQVAAYFQALAEPTRLQIMNLLRSSEHNVGEIAAFCDCSSANVSRHLALLTRQGLVAREARGNTVYHKIADESVYTLCDLVCNRIASRMTKSLTEQKAFARIGRPARTGASRKKT